MPIAPCAGSAHAHGEEAYNDRMSRAGALPFGLVTVAIASLVGGGGRRLCAHDLVSGSAPFPRAPGRRRSSARAGEKGRLRGHRRRSRCSRHSRPGASSRSPGRACRAMHGTVQIERCSTPPSTRRSLSSAGAPPEAVLVLGLFALGTAAIGGHRARLEGVEAFNGNRLAAPTGYENASAALFLMAFWPAVALAARPEVHWAARSLLLAAGALLLQLALLAQSRGSLVAGGRRPAGARPREPGPAPPSRRTAPRLRGCRRDPRPAARSRRRRERSGGPASRRGGACGGRALDRWRSC